MSSFSDTRPSAPLRAAIRARLAAGSLPQLAADHRIYAGFGNNEVCSGCGQLVAEREVLYEVELGPQGASRPMALHLNCFTAWVLESEAESVGLSGTADDVRSRKSGSSAL